MDRMPRPGGVLPSSSGLQEEEEQVQSTDASLESDDSLGKHLKAEQHICDMRTFLETFLNTKESVKRLNYGGSGDVNEKTLKSDIYGRRRKYS